jgi:hypothetical protein
VGSLNAAHGLRVGEMETSQRGPEGKEFKIENYATTGLYEPPPEDAIYCKSDFQILSKPTKAVDALQFTYKGPRILE